ncbi:hypothetical protein CONPUDRAFT_159653 [Coniophora puteana RWD-64-598 SS2]|uniref:Uncharacterized protein n=1 Tax=Coniophora puteana (strain RWD-64-598) TaxID=741705 RepID=A0A5M3M6Z3_CONPW|nr:uncharacterized protein CONPUDRAFT_159653 [Coniophora puteana RWD-64-598 SS2]EIW74877.1 hypothetical protein CONPUDRAFT_159653 [Coniophora puteana RWD-64-598 SS2]
MKISAKEQALYQAQLLFHCLLRQLMIAIKLATAQGNRYLRGGGTSTVLRLENTTGLNRNQSACSITLQFPRTSKRVISTSIAQEKSTKSGFGRLSMFGFK